jgi:uncharacterized RDD family membrane protein YckC
MVHDVNNRPKYDNIAIPGQRLFVGPASPIKRLAAFAVDLLIINFVFMLPFEGILKRVFPNSDYSSAFNMSFTKEMIIVTFFLGILLLCYFVIFEFFMAQTPGKMFFGLHVVSIKSKEKKLKRISFTQVFIRNLFLIPVFPLGILIFIDPIFSVFNNNHQRLLEIISKTVVIERFNYDV